MRFFLISYFLILTLLNYSQVNRTNNAGLPINNRTESKAGIKDTLRNPVEDSLAILRKKLEKFEYSSVINGINHLLLKKEELLKKELIEAYLFKAVSHFALAEDENAERSFNEILKIDSTFTLDSTKISPKIISFFKKVKENFYTRSVQNPEKSVARVDTVYIPRIYEREVGNKVSQAVIRSIIFPGLGHLYTGSSIKAWVLTGLTASALGSAIYFWWDTDRKEKLYTKESDPGLIEYRYKKYNRAYKLRNISIAALVGVWLYSQIDLLFFSDLFEIDFNQTEASSLSHIGIKFTYRF
ncbi:MAG TPA: hypothetical protein VMT35_12015 [Ignavibacteriaceae bacterium]|nr:hypothetical protein [Ignavibacteriaceae bacterium]